MSVVNVLTPNGRRQNVKVQPSTTVLQVLEEVCKKHNFDPEEYDLKHHKRILDLSLMYRFTGLPNNAQLEMVETLKKRQDQEVGLVVQLSDGSRVEGTFKPVTSLADILQQLCPDELASKELVVIYMRTEVLADKLTDTTLKELGLISGRAILRLIHRDPNAAKTQANVSSVLQPKPQPLSEDLKREPKKLKEDESHPVNSILSAIQAERRQIDGEEELGTQTEVLQDEEKAGEPSAEKMDIDDGPLNQSLAASSSLPGCSSSTSALKMEEEKEEDIGEVIILGERNAILFSLETSAKIACDEPDSFYDLDVCDMKGILRQLRSEFKGSSEQPLLTAQMRELEKSKQQLDRLNRYKKTIIRIQFPNRLVLQGTFGPMETIETVKQFIQGYLESPEQDFHLFITPPKNVLSNESRLFEVNCVPSAVLYFGSTEIGDRILREDILSKVSSPNAAIFFALKEREMTDRNPPNDDTEEASIVDISSPSTGTGAIPKQRNEEFQASSISPNITSDTKMPKWFNPVRKL